MHNALQYHKPGNTFREEQWLQKFLGKKKQLILILTEFIIAKWVFLIFAIKQVQLLNRGCY